MITAFNIFETRIEVAQGCAGYGAKDANADEKEINADRLISVLDLSAFILKINPRLSAVPNY